MERGREFVSLLSLLRLATKDQKGRKKFFFLLHVCCFAAWKMQQPDPDLDEDELDRQDKFESDYNMRFESQQDNIISFPRVIEDSVRQLRVPFHCLTPPPPFCFEHQFVAMRGGGEGKRRRRAEHGPAPFLLATLQGTMMFEKPTEQGFTQTPRQAQEEARGSAAQERKGATGKGSQDAGAQEGEEAGDFREDSRAGQTSGARE